MTLPLAAARSRRGASAALAVGAGTSSARPLRRDTMDKPVLRDLIAGASESFGRATDWLRRSVGARTPPVNGAPLGLSGTAAHHQARRQLRPGRRRGPAVPTQ